MRHRPRSTSAETLESRWLLSAQPYTWQNAAIGAGGFVDGIFYSPSQPNVIYARTDIGGVYKTTDDGAAWQQLLDWVPATTGQMMGVLSVAIDPENANNLYLEIGEYSDTNGWVLSSTNGGASFTTTNLPFYVGGNSSGRGTGERLAVDPNLGSILFLGSNDHGLYQSSNSAGSFSASSAFNALVGSSSGITFVSFDPRSGTPGHASQTIYVGVDSTGGGTNIYKTTNGGSSWSELSGGPSGLIPMQAALDADGNMYFTFSNALPPDGSITNGAVWRYNTSASAWASISPVIPGAASGDNFGYCGLAVDPEQAGTVVVTSFDRYSYIDTLWRTTDAGAASPTWVALYDHGSSQNYGYGGYNTTRNTSNAPWTAGNGDGIGNWAAAVAIDPFNSAQLMYGTGQGIWATNNATSATPLSAANSWYFPDDGIEFTAASAIAAPASGIPLYSALGDIGGFSHTTLTTSPAAGNNNGGTDNDIDFAQSNPSDAAIIGNFTNGGAYSTNAGLTWTPFASSAGSGGTIAVAANGASLVWAPGGSAPFYSTDNGTTWTASTMPASPPGNSSLTGEKVISDRVNPNYFYYWTENSSDNSFILYVSSDGGATFTLASQTATGNCSLVANPFTAGDLWLTCYGPLYESANFGASFTYKVNNNPVSSASKIALGKSAPGQSYPTIYIWGTIAGTTGVFRSDDKAATWVRINDSAHQWGGNITSMAADPSTFGRVYLAFNGRGIIIGNPANALPAGWSDMDIGVPGNPGYVTDLTTLSNGTTVNQWTVDGGGAGITGSGDQLNFTGHAVTGNYAAEAELKSLSNNGSGAPEAGVMFRAGTNPNDPFAALLQTTASQLLFEYRATAGGSISSVTLNSVAIGGEYLDLVRSGNTFTAYCGTDGINWTQLGSPMTISAMPATANAGLAITAAFNPQLSSAVFGNVQIVPGPTIVTAAAAVPSTTTANLSVLGGDTDGEASLIYNWAATSVPAGAAMPTFSSNDSNAAKATVAQFHAAGDYSMTVTITDSLQQSVTSTVTVTIDAVPGAIQISPANISLVTGATQTFAASGTDQFGNAIGGFAWSATGGTIDPATGQFTAGQTGGAFTITAAVGSTQGSTSATVVPIAYSDTGGNNTYAIDINPSDAGQLRIFVNTPETGEPTYSIELSQVPSLSFIASTGDDTLTIDSSNGNPIPAGGADFAGGVGDDAISVIGTPGNNSVFINATQLTLNSSILTYSGTQTISITTGAGDDVLTQTAQPTAAVVFNGGAGTDTLNINAGTYVFGADPAYTTAALIVNDNSSVDFSAAVIGAGISAMHLAQLNVGPGAAAMLSPAPASTDRTVLVASGLSMASSATLDIQNNDMIIRGGSLASVAALIARGYNSGAWNGAGVYSSAAAMDTAHLATIGVISNNGPSGTLFYASFDGQAVSSDDILLKYTYVGDANLDGQVDGSDYTKTDNGFNSHLSGWLNGDFNYDGEVDGSDYTLIDNAFNTQGAAFPAAALATTLGSVGAIKALPSENIAWGNNYLIAAALPAKISVEHGVDQRWCAGDGGAFVPKASSGRQSREAVAHCKAEGFGVLGSAEQDAKPKKDQQQTFEWLPRALELGIG